MTEVIARVHSVHLLNVEQHQVAANPQIKPTHLGFETASFRQLSSTTTITTPASTLLNHTSPQPCVGIQKIH